MHDKMTDENLQYDVNRTTAKISELSSCKVDKYEYLKDKEILPSEQHRIIEEAKSTLLRNTFEKQKLLMSREKLNKSKL